MFEFRLPKNLRRRKIKSNSREDIEPQEVFLDNLAQKKERELGISEKKFEVPLPQKILRYSYFAFLVIILIFFIKTFEIQVLKCDYFSSLAKENKARIELTRAERGVIYDRSGKQLVRNQPSFDLVLDKRDLPWDNKDRERILKEISKIADKDFEKLRKEVEESENPQILLLENIPQEKLILLETNPLVSEEKSLGLKIEKNTVRDYLSGPIFSQLVGYTGKIDQNELKKFQDHSVTDYIGKTGLERSYEEILRGNPGKIQIENDVFGNFKSKEKVSDPEPGKSLALWLDSDLQSKAGEELEKSLQKTGAKRGAVIAMDPKTGGILSLVSLPNYDNNLFSKGVDIGGIKKILDDPLQPLFNLVISGEYPTGSTIKPLMASAALQEKIISPEKQIFDTGKIEVPNEYNPEIIYTFLDWKPHGWVDLRKAIAVSCNVYFYTVGGGYKDQKGLGAERIKKYLQFFGWGTKTGIDLPGEKEGLIPDSDWKIKNIGEDWYTGDTYNLSIGQGYLGVTPLQVVTAFSAIANGGKLLQPQVVQKIIDNQKGTSEEIKPKIIRENFIDPENLRIVREGMRDAVTYGSSVILNDLSVRAAAKTGTAETGKERVYHNWVTVFAPYDDPQIVLTVVIEKVPEAQVAALPVAKGILEWYFSR